MLYICFSTAKVEGEVTTLDTTEKITKMLHKKRLSDLGQTAFDFLGVSLTILTLLDLSFHSIQSQIHSLLKCASLLLGYYIATRNMQCY